MNVVIEEERIVSLDKYLNSESEKTLGFGKFRVKESKTINMLLVGRTQTGKSTIIHTLLDPQNSVIATGMSTTKDPIFRTLIVNYMGIAYQLNIFDTPALQEVRKEGDTRDDDQLLKLTELCIKNEVTYLNLVAFVSPAGKTNLLDIGSFQKLKKFLGDEFSKISLMLLTNCDKYVHEKLEDFKNTIRNHFQSKQVFEFCRLGFLEIGAINLQQIRGVAMENQELVEQMVQQKLIRIEQMRRALIEGIIKNSDMQVRIESWESIKQEIQKAEEKILLNQFMLMQQNKSAVTSELSANVDQEFLDEELDMPEQVERFLKSTFLCFIILVKLKLDLLLRQYKFHHSII